MVAVKGTKAGRSWYLAYSLVELWSQVNEFWPKRDKGSDGSIASPQHTTINPGSDHEPAIWDPELGLWVVTALDLTDDDDDADMYEICEEVRISKDPRLKYCIHFRDGRKSMFSSYPAHGYSAWEWRPYSGSNPHKNHAHFSTVSRRIRYNSVEPWSVGGTMLTAKEEDNVRKWSTQLEALNSNGGYIKYLLPDVRKNIVTMDELEAALKAIQTGNVDSYARDLARRNREKLEAIKEIL